jgi:eukaryotic-like serine/threonine-protein kinase
MMDGAENLAGHTMITRVLGRLRSQSASWSATDGLLRGHDSVAQVTAENTNGFGTRFLEAQVPICAAYLHLRELMSPRYEIIEQLGQGGSGCVFRAYDKTLKRQVAIKRLLTAEEAVRTDDATTAIKREAATMAQLRHEHIVTTYDIAEDDKGLFIVMDFAEGSDLEEWLKYHPLAWNDYVQVVTQTLDAMLTAHRLRILHLDLKPANIRVQRLPDGRLKTTLIDFGLSQLAAVPEKQRRAEDGRLFGSVHYMAPEQFRLEPLDTRTDLYALGCIYYECLSGKAPFSGSTSVAVRDAHLAHDVIPLHQRRPELPIPLCDWVMWLLHPDRNQRPNDAAVALQSFQTICYQITAWSAQMYAPVSHSAAPTAAIPLVTGPISPGSSTKPQLPARPAPIAKGAQASRSSVQPKPTSQRLPLPAILGAAALVLLGAGWLLLGGKSEEAAQKSPMSESAVTAETPDKRQQADASAPPLIGAATLPRGEKLVARFIAGEQTFTFEDLSNPKLNATSKNAELGDAVARWDDVAPSARTWQLKQAGKVMVAAPRLKQIAGAGLKKPRAALSFERDQSLSNPIEPWQPTQGYTVALVLRLRGMPQGTQRNHVLTMNADGKDSGMFNFNIITLMDKGRPVLGAYGSMPGEDGYYALRFDHPINDNIQIMVVTLEPGSKKIRGTLQPAQGEPAEATALVRQPLTLAYTRVRFGARMNFDVIAENGVGFTGDILEFILYPVPLSNSETETLRSNLMSFYVR